jgi:undecaprenyl-diphosphatase
LIVARPGVRRERSPRWLRDAERIDLAVYASIAATPTPALDRAMSRLTRAADRSQLWLGASALLVVGHGRRGRRAAGAGVAAIAVTSAVVNGMIKPLGRRHRPDAVSVVPLGRRVRMPLSTSFPSGHAASAFAFATAVGYDLPREAAALRVLAALVAYSRVHTGVHYPADVVAGSLLGSAAAQLTRRALDRGSVATRAR